MILFYPQSFIKISYIFQFTKIFLEFSNIFTDENNQPLKHWKSQYFDGQLPVTAISEDSMENENEISKNRSSVSVGVLSAEEKQTFVMIIYSEEISTKVLEFSSKISNIYFLLGNPRQNFSFFFLGYK